MRKVKFFVRRLGHALKAVGQSLNAQSYDEARFWEMHGDVYEVTNADTAEWLGVKWNGRPFVLYPTWHYDAYDYVFDLLELFRYIVSGEAQADMCRDADDAMLANAY